MAITFYGLSGSPFSWKVWLALEHKRLAYDLNVLSADAGDLKKLEFLRFNPRGKVPVLIDDGLVLYESGPIVEYLEDRYADAGEPLWPNDAGGRALARRIAAEASEYVYPHVRKLVVELLMRNDGVPDLSAISAAKTQLASELHALGSTMKGGYLAGNNVSVADFTLYPLTAVLKRIHVRKPAHEAIRTIPDSIHEWMGRVESLPYFTKTIPPHWKTS